MRSCKGNHRTGQAFACFNILSSMFNRKTIKFCFEKIKLLQQ